jgi:hypothetical protein
MDTTRLAGAAAPPEGAGLTAAGGTGLRTVRGDGFFDAIRATFGLHSVLEVIGGGRRDYESDSVVFFNSLAVV